MSSLDPKHLPPQLAEQFDPVQIRGLTGRDLSGAFEGLELAGRFVGVLANPASGNPTGFQQEFALVRHPATERKGFFDHDRFADVKLLQIRLAIASSTLPVVG